MYRCPGSPGITLDDVLSPSALCYVFSTFTGLIISITRIFSPCPNPLCTLIITTAPFEMQSPSMEMERIEW